MAFLHESARYAHQNGAHIQAAMMRLEGRVGGLLATKAEVTELEDSA